MTVWRRDENGEAVYEIVHANIRDVSLAGTLAQDAGKAPRGG